jgi:hypothetical protein
VDFSLSGSAVVIGRLQAQASNNIQITTMRMGTFKHLVLKRDFLEKVLFFFQMKRVKF